MIVLPPVFLMLLVYVLIWWTALFAVLPFFSRPDPQPDPVSGLRGGSRPPVVKIILANSAVSALLWAAAMLVICHRDWLSFRSGWLAIDGD